MEEEFTRRVTEDAKKTNVLKFRLPRNTIINATKHGTLSLKYCKDFKINIKNLISCHFFELMSAKYMVVCLGCRTSDLG